MFEPRIERAREIKISSFSTSPPLKPSLSHAPQSNQPTNEELHREALALLEDDQKDELGIERIDLLKSGSPLWFKSGEGIDLKSGKKNWVSQLIDELPQNLSDGFISDVIVKCISKDDLWKVELLKQVLPYSDNLTMYEQADEIIDNNYHSILRYLENECSFDQVLEHLGYCVMEETEHLVLIGEDL